MPNALATRALLLCCLTAAACGGSSDSVGGPGGASGGAGSGAGSGGSNADCGDGHVCDLSPGEAGLFAHAGRLMAASIAKDADGATSVQLEAVDTGGVVVAAYGASPDGGLVLYSVRGSTGLDLWLSAPGRNERWLVHPEGALWASFVDAGARIVFLTRSGDLLRVPVDAVRDQSEPEAERLASDVSGASLAPDGERVALWRAYETPRTQPGLFVLALSSGQERSLGVIGDAGIRGLALAPIWSHDGEHVYMPSRDDDDPTGIGLSVAAAAGGGQARQIELPASAPSPGIGAFVSEDGWLIYPLGDFGDVPTRLAAARPQGLAAPMAGDALLLGEGHPVAWIVPGRELLVATDALDTAEILHADRIGALREDALEEVTAYWPGSGAEFLTAWDDGRLPVSGFMSLPKQTFEAHTAYVCYRNRTSGDMCVTGGACEFLNYAGGNCGHQCCGPHKGIDYAMRTDPDIRATADGTVVYVYNACSATRCRWGSCGCLGASPYRGYGNVVQIDHHNGFFSMYGHMSEVSVSVGDRVTCGQVIGVVGSSGYSTGPHLHFEIRTGDSLGSQVDPYEGPLNKRLSQSLWVDQNGGNPASTCVQPGPPPFDPPRALEPANGAVLETRRPTFKWEPASGAAGTAETYIIQWGTDLDRPDGSYRTDPAAGQTSRLTGDGVDFDPSNLGDFVDVGKRYRWRVKGCSRDYRNCGEFNSPSQFSVAEPARPPACTAGATRCERSNVLRCEDDGSGWVPVVSCERGCTSGPDGASCGDGPPPVCRPGDTECSGRSLRRCTDDGRSWETLRTCSDACENARCVSGGTTGGSTGGSTGGASDVCAPGDRRCAGNVVQACRDDGAGWYQVQSCSSYCDAGYCGATDGGGVEEWGVLCYPGETRCRNATSVERCASDGAQFEFAESCEHGCALGACAPDAGTSQVCPPDVAGCRGDEAVRCRADGSGWSVLETCSGGCEAGACLQSSGARTVVTIRAGQRTYIKNGASVQMTADMIPYNTSGCFFVGAALVSEVFGWTRTWSSATRINTIEDGLGGVVTLKEGERTVRYADGGSRSLCGANVVNSQGRMMSPVRWSEALGVNVVFDSAANAVTLSW